jgi:hypothetical protein
MVSTTTSVGGTATSADDRSGCRAPVRRILERDAFLNVSRYRSFEMAGEYAEAERIVREMLAADSTNVDFRGELAGLAAERGDTALADSLDHWLSRQPATRVGWSASVYRARVAALLGRPTDAVARTRDALDQGAWPLWIHLEPALVTLRMRPEFVALTAPRS